MEQIAEILISGLLVVAGIFGIVGSFGLMKLPETMTRLHAPTKATTLGVGGVLIASMFYYWVFQGHFSMHELLITMFLLLTAPITANFIAKAFMHRANVETDLPKDPGGQEWATFADEAKPLEPRMTELSER
ncbi:MAG: Na+/H+ antiporter subunit G [Pseudorhodobacter sp.]